MQSILLAIVGPTAVGKSALALRLARRLNGEIVTADSRQVYRHMDVGTAKPPLEDSSEIPHHVIDVVNPDEDYSLALYLRQAADAIRDIYSHSKLPVLEGGTGQYVWGLLEGWQVPEVPPDPELRLRLESRAAAEGPAALYEELARLDPGAASRIDSRNLRRVVRALEVCYSSPKGYPSPPQTRPPPYHVKVLGLTLQRSCLYQRIDDRVERMMDSGWIDEVRALLDMGYRPDLPSMSSLGYRELVQYLGNELTLQEAVQRMKYRTHRFARQQYAWFRLTDKRIHWLDASRELDDVEEETMRWLEEAKAPLDLHSNSDHAF